MNVAIAGTVLNKQMKPIKHAFLRENGILDLFQQTDPQRTLQSGKLMAIAWAKKLESYQQLPFIQDFIRLTVISYWQTAHNLPVRQKPLPELYAHISFSKQDNSVKAIAEVIGKAAAQLDVTNAAFYLGSLYTSLLPDNMRSENGVFYTPSALSSRLIEMSLDANKDWGTISVTDPACGSGAFLIPVALKIANALKRKSASAILQHIETHLKGYEIDPFAAWLCQVFIEVALKDIISAAGRHIVNLVTVCNTLEHQFTPDEKFDLVIGNPPYGKIKLTDKIASKYKQSLYGHPNLYGLFIHLAINITKENGAIAYLTPTSFLSGEYFKNLRLFIRKNAIPLEVDFVSVRKGVFEDVLQETMLATYKINSCKPIRQPKLKVNEFIALPDGRSAVNKIGDFNLPENLATPWILSRKPGQTNIVQTMSRMKARLNDWGYRISTGQLVWNRFKEQLTDIYSKGCYPIVWSEAITQDGNFNLKSEKKNHSRWFAYKKGDDFLLTNSPCILLQRTTAKEQDKRLIAAILPTSLIEERKSVIVENHLNMIVPITHRPFVSLEVLSVFLNSKAVNDAFRTISGSVAVSAYELEALPLPDISCLSKLQTLVAGNASNECIEKECTRLYQNK
jgi:adenine-specific DNA-methyltransferase